MALLSFYTIATVSDRNESSTLLYENVIGTLQINTTSRGTANQGADPEIVEHYVFFPSKVLSGITDEMSVVDSNGDKYTVEHVRNYEDETQEIYLLKCD